MRFLLLLFFSSLAWGSELVVWNVGQGQWVTEVRDQLCVHYDIGGEVNVTRQVLQKCKGRRQILVLSHWDWDHLSFAAKFAGAAGRTCIWRWPLGPGAQWKEKMLRQIDLCSEGLNLQEIFAPSPDRKLASNDLSRVFLVGGVLLPGDSTARMEKRWARKASSARGLVLGHHGSKTSTSRYLLDRLPGLQWAVASARQRRFGHPHPDVVKRLRERRIPLLRTEDWGHIHFMR